MARPVYPFRPGDWVATEHGRVAKVKHVWSDGVAPVLLDLVIIDRRGKQVGRESPAMGGPRSFEPACDPEGWIRISEPTFPLDLRWVTEDGVTTARWGTGRPLPPANWSPPERRSTPKAILPSAFTQAELAHLATLLAQANDPMSAMIGQKAAALSRKDQAG